MTPGSPWEIPDWNRVAGAPSVRGVIRAEAEDFQVEEIPLITPLGEGSHLWLEIRKRNANTEWVARQLAALAGVPGRDIGFAGMKDRHGVTSQWFSIALQEAENSNWQEWKLPDAEILAAYYHNRKLRRGALRGNRFRILVRALEGRLEELDNRLRTVAAQGVPNFFGPQRFGHGGRNVSQGVRWLERGGRLTRNKKSIYLSAVRSFLFNELLARRVELGNWNRIIDGDIACLDGSHSTFPCAMPDPELTRRCEAFDIHPGGPLPGAGGPQPERDAAEIENRVLAPYEAQVFGLIKAGLKSGRRPLRLLPKDLRWSQAGDQLSLEFSLASGGFATSVLRELVSIEAATISETE